MEAVLAEYVRSPTVTIIVQSFVGEYARQIRVVGQAAQPQALSYRNGMTVLDVLIAVGGLSEIAAGNRARIVRRLEGEEITINVRLNDLLNKGEMELSGPNILEETVVKVNRCAKVVKGGRRFSFSALVVLGNKAGRVGVGFGKAKEVPAAVEKAVKDARKKLDVVHLKDNTIWHEVTGRYRATKVRLIPAAPGTGIIAGASVRAVVEASGIKDLLTKAYGSTNPVNLVKATLTGLTSIRSREEMEKLRGVKA